LPKEVKEGVSSRCERNSSSKETKSGPTVRELNFWGRGRDVPYQKGQVKLLQRRVREEKIPSRGEKIKKEEESPSKRKISEKKETCPEPSKHPEKKTSLLISLG